MVLVLLETPGGYAFFRLQKPGLLKVDASEIRKHFESTDEASKTVTLQAFHKFKNSKDALSDATALMESKIGKGLKKCLKKIAPEAQLDQLLIVSDKLLGAAIKKKFNLNIVVSDTSHEIIRGVREQLEELIEGFTEKDAHTMALSLSHTISRFKLKFSPEKVDTMIIQAVSLLDDIDKEVNNFVMRLKEWYGWHFPELTKIVTDNIVYAHIIKHIGMRSNTKHCTTLHEIVPEPIENEIRQAAEVSMGTDITEEDLLNIQQFGDRVIELNRYRATLSDYLKVRMEAIAPNLTCLVGELVGARLISHAGSLMNLAKHPASTVQILGAEKALFRALKAKQATPKYGLIYHAHAVCQSLPKLKGKASRILAAKLSLCSRVDALGNPTDSQVGSDCRYYVERRIEEIKEEALRASMPLARKQEPKKYIPDHHRTSEFKLDDTTDFLPASKRPLHTQEPSSNPKKLKNF